jgi:DNA-binding MarR family transcriptional regulator
MNGPDAAAREVWLLMTDVVIENTRRREVSEALGMSFGRTRAIRRLARRSMSMGELADVLQIDPPNATALVDELEAQGLARRKPHPTDGRAKLVEATRKGKALGARANQILSVPPPALTALGADELATLLRILESVSESDEA